MTQPVITKVLRVPLGTSLAPWREWVEPDDPREKLLNGSWNRIDRVIPFAQRPTPTS